MSRTPLLPALGAAVLAVALIGPGSPAGAAPPSTPSGVSPAPDPARRVTLVTGDVVTYTARTGAPPTVTVDAAPRAGRVPPSFLARGDRTGYYVIPSDAQAAVTAGTVDAELFNVARLSRTRDKDLGLLVKGPAVAAGLPAARLTARIPTAGLAGVRVPPARAAQFWTAVAPKLGTTITRLALDRSLHVTLDESVPMIGAPAVWRAGFDGTGVTVGVLDTGIDATHPDFAGRIIEARSFIDGEDSTDTYGHGTHVASTIAGSGAASGGRYKGVAPGAKLLIGKVCDGSGACPESAIMAGLEWVAGKAKAVNLSLGGEPSDGTDELSTLVDALTARTGTLFVIAAGNAGCAPCVAAPGAAASALTVGAVDKQDRLAAFSNRGPRLGDATVKPEIVAPGVTITAARAKGTFPDIPGDPNYVPLSGTSMATPHVTGSVALLAQARPTAAATQLKDALVSAAKDDALSWNAQGAGRLDVARAVTQKVTGPASASFGRLDRAATPATRTLTYTNATPVPVTLAAELSVTSWSGRAPVAGQVTLSNTTVSVPAGGAAALDVVVDPGLGEAGAYGGVLTATGPGGVTLRTPVSWYVPYPPKPHATLTIGQLGFDGETVAEDGPVTVIRDEVSHNPNDPFDAGELFFWAHRQGGVWVASVPEGTYAVLSQHSDIRPQRRRWVALTATNVTVGAHGGAVTLDARTAVPSRAQVPEPTWEYDHQIGVTVNVLASTSATLFFPSRGDQSIELYATPTAPAAKGSVTAQQSFTLGQRAVRLRAGGKDLAAQFEPYEVTSELAGDRDLPLVFAGAGTPDDFARAGVKGKAALVRLPTPTTGGGWDRYWSAVQAAQTATAHGAEAGAVTVLPYLDTAGALPIGPRAGHGPANPSAIPQMSLGNADGERLRTSAGILQMRVRPNPSAMYHLHFGRGNGIAADLTHRVDPGSLERVRSRYHADVAGLGLAQWWLAFRTDSGGAAANPSIYLTAPAAVDDYVGPVEPKDFWRRAAGIEDRDHNMFSQVDFSRSRGTREDWLAGPIAMATPDSGDGAGFFRWGPDRLFTSPYLNDGSFGHVADVDWGDVYPFTYRLFRDGQQIPGRPYPGLHTPYFDLPADPGRYRLEGTFILPPTNPWYSPSQAVRRMSPRVETAWTFTSRRPTADGCGPDMGSCARQPVLQLRYDLGVSLTNTAEAGQTHRIGVHVGAPHGAVGAGRIAGLILSYSTDQGRTWRSAPVAGSSGDFVARVPDPTAGGTVWLRTEAWDTAGNRVQQTVHQAYAVVR
ncbi:S8 family serine peptidase [Krasilnikovia sp. MM14-A1004]|uniref:S8 family serine peptidase n=1 Tax=Krasilnikovia sp. MM14-A1004 TaxID=3373541 RepID=UPI00399CD665